MRSDDGCPSGAEARSAWVGGTQGGNGPEDGGPEDGGPEDGGPEEGGPEDGAGEGGAGRGGKANGDNVVDADFEEVKDDKKRSA